ncbi:hypothetical protein AB0C31_10800, partial [Actinoplanes philippinensis]
DQSLGLRIRRPALKHPDPEAAPKRVHRLGQLAREPFQPAVLGIWTSLGVQLRRLGAGGAALSEAGSALVNYVLGAAAQHAAGARRAPDDAARRAYLERLAARWAQHDADAAVQESAALLAGHDDREQFLAGVDIFLTGVVQRQISGM